MQQSLPRTEKLKSSTTNMTFFFSCSPWFITTLTFLVNFKFDAQFLLTFLSNQSHVLKKVRKGCDLLTVSKFGKKSWASTTWTTLFWSFVYCSCQFCTKILLIYGYCFKKTTIAEVCHLPVLKIFGAKKGNSLRNATFSDGKSFFNRKFRPVVYK